MFGENRVECLPKPVPGRLPQKGLCYDKNQGLSERALDSVVALTRQVTGGVADVVSRHVPLLQRGLWLVSSRPAWWTGGLKVH